MIPENFDNLQAANTFAAAHRAVVDENASLRDRLGESAARLAAAEAEFAMTLASPLAVLRHQAEAWRRRLFGRI
jgi:hypothetical protein